MAPVIITSDEQLSLAPNDCGCSEHRGLSRPVPEVASNDCGGSGAAAPQPGFVSGALLRPHPRLRVLPLIESYRVAFVPSHGQVAVLDAAAVALLRRLPLAPAAGAPGERRALASLMRAGLLTDGAAPLPVAPPPPATLVAWFHLTNACNLRCGYCYIRKGRAAMTEATARAAVDTLVATALRHAFPDLVIKYAGGEPTLALPVLAATHRYARERAAAHGLTLRGSVLSNGALLTPAAARLLRDLDLDLMLSLDGLGGIHDGQRPTVGGRPSFARARAGIERALAADLRPTIGITVTGRSVAGLPDLVAWLLEAELPFGISFYREPSGGGEESWRLEEERLIAGMRAAYAVIARRPPPWSLLASLVDRADLSAAHPRSCAAGHHYLVIDHQGQVAACQMRLDQPVTTLAAEDPLAAIRADAGLRNLAVDDKPACRQCDWRYWCGGGCPVAIHRATGGYDAPSPYCRVYQELYPEVIRLEGLHLLRWFGPAP